jgi:CHASE2 domain-containing sensor protein
MVSSNKLFTIGLVALIVVLLLSILFPGLFDSFDKTFSKLEYRLRGESKVDSSIVILYLNNDDIEALGGLPLKRTYYALTITALKELGAKVIGIDIAFTDENIKHPEYDALLSTVVKNADNVILSCYFRNIGIENRDSTVNFIPDKLTYKNIFGLNWQKGYQINLPYSRLLFSTKSVGHTHIDETSIPLFIQNDGSLVPAFALEIFREAVGVPKANVLIQSNNLTIQTETGNYKIPYDKNGNTAINFVGSSKSLNMISIVNFLKSYDDFKGGFKPIIPIETFRDKIVLIGIVAEGRSKFIATPYEEEFPAIGLHAMFLHNVLHNNFLVGCSVVCKYLIIILIGSLNILFISFKKELNRWISVILLMVIYIIVALILFYIMHYTLPITSIIFTIILITLSTYIYRQKVVKANIVKMIEEKEALNKLLWSTLCKNIA